MMHVSYCRSGIHNFVSVAMLIGFAGIMAGMVFVVLEDGVDVFLSHTGCAMSNLILHKTGPGTAYMGMTISNMGSTTITDINITLYDDDQTPHHLYNSSEIYPGYGSEQYSIMNATITPSRHYAIGVLAHADDGSVAECSAVYRVL